MDELYSDLNVCKSGTATANKILSGYTAYYNGELVEGEIESKGKATYTPGTSNQTIESGKYLSGTQTIKGDSNLVASNIKCGTTIFGVTGTNNCTLYDKVKVGDYVSMTPTKTSFIIPAFLTGYSSNQTIKPSELKLWRVIRKNSDGTIDMVSEYVSSTNVTFQGKTGYLNYMGTLNYIAKQYENPKYTSGSRYMGYNGQTEYITDTSKFTTTAPWTSNTSNNNNESQGGGDTLYTTDINLVKNAIGSLVANKQGTTTVTSYWSTGRFYYYSSASEYYWAGHYVNDTDGRTSICWLYQYLNGGWKDISNNFAIRPIITLKSGINASSGSGTSSSPLVLS